MLLAIRSRWDSIAINTGCLGPFLWYFDPVGSRKDGFLIFVTLRSGIIEYIDPEDPRWLLKDVTSCHIMAFMVFWSSGV